MKRKLATVLLTSSILFPSVSYAVPSESDLQPYLNDIGWTKTELEEYLVFYDSTLEDYQNFEELQAFLGPVLSEENLAELLLDYDMTLEEATDLLLTNGELKEGQTILDAYTFLDDVDVDLSYYDVTPITEESLEQLLLDYELTLEELQTLLEENGDSLDNYAYIEDLDWAIYIYIYETAEEDLAEIEDLFSQIGFTEEELNQLFEHFMTLDIENPAFLEKLEELANRMAAFEEFDTATELTAGQIAELAEIYNQSLNLLELEVQYSLIKDDEKKPVSLATLFAMTTTDGYDLLAELHNLDGQFLADMVLTAEMLGSELITETGEDLKKTEEIIQTKIEKKTVQPSAQKVSDKKIIQTAEKTETEVVAKTTSGGKLPDTATGYTMNIAAGFGMILSGLFLYRRFNWKNN